MSAMHISLLCLRDEHKECVRRLVSEAGDPSRADAVRGYLARIEYLNTAIMALARHGIA